MNALMLGAILISFSSVMVVLGGLPPDVVGFYRLFGGGLVLLAMVARGGKLGEFSPHVLRWGVVGGLFYAGDFFFWHRSIGYVGPGLATMLGNFQVIPLALVSMFFFKEALSAKQYVAIPLALAGLYLMVGVQWSFFTPEYRMGVVFGLLTAMLYALYLLSLKYSMAGNRADPLVMMAGVSLVGGLLLGGTAVAQGESFVFSSIQSFAAIAALAFICHAVGAFLVARGVQTVRGAVVGLILILQPTLSFIWDILFFDKPVVGVELAGMGLALVGIYVGSLKSGK